MTADCVFIFFRQKIPSPRTILPPFTSFRPFFLLSLPSKMSLLKKNLSGQKRMFIGSGNLFIGSKGVFIGSGNPFIGSGGVFIGSGNPFIGSGGSRRVKEWECRECKGVQECKTIPSVYNRDGFICLALLALLHSLYSPPSTPYLGVLGEEGSNPEGDREKPRRDIEVDRGLIEV